MDVGDDFAEEVKRSVTSVIGHFMMRSSLSRGGGIHLGGGGSSKNKNRNHGFTETIKSELDNIAHDLKAPSKRDALSSLPIERPDMIVVAANIKDAEFLRSVMEKNKIEYSVLREKNATTGKFEFVFRLPDRVIDDEVSIHAPFSKTDHVIRETEHPFTTLSELQEKSPEVMELLKLYARDNEISALGSNGHIHGAQIPMKSFVHNAPENFKFDFKTIKWDREAEILTSFFEERGIPYQIEHLDNSTVRFELDPQYAQSVKSICDIHINNEVGRNISKGRFLDYDALTDPDKRISYSTKTQTHDSTHEQTRHHANNQIKDVTIDRPEVAAVLKEEFSKEGLPFESFTEKDSGKERFIVDSADLQKSPEKIDRILSRVESISSKEIGGITKKHSTKRSVQNPKDINRKSIQSQKEQGYSTQRTHKPHKDAQIAQISAQARNRDQISKVPAVTRGGRK